MQYKQLPRVAFEIFDVPDAPLKIRLAVLRFLANSRSFPKLGPYRKRSPEQVLWRIASDAQLGGAERWEALKKLLKQAASAEDRRYSSAPKSDPEERQGAPNEQARAKCRA